MNELPVFIPLRFQVAVLDQHNNLLCRGAFSEVSGLEATMTPKTVKEGGRNWGEIQLAGPVTFQPVVLKRGVTDVGDLWSWFDIVHRQGSLGLRYSARIEVFHPEKKEPLLRVTLANVLPSRFKGPDLAATASQVAIEELTLVHEGLTLERGG
ncbi:MAG: phage tail protein [Thermodesulfobacteriota bacterium]